MPRPTRQMCECVNFNHCWRNKGSETCSIVIKTENGLELKNKKCVLIGGKHEDKPDNPDNEKVMDLHNNERGRIIGEIVKTIDKLWLFKGYDDVIAELVMEAMRSGKLITKPEG